MVVAGGFWGVLGVWIGSSIYTHAQVCLRVRAPVYIGGRTVLTSQFHILESLWVCVCASIHRCAARSTLQNLGTLEPMSDRRYLAHEVPSNMYFTNMYSIYVYTYMWGGGGVLHSHTKAIILSFSFCAGLWARFFRLVCANVGVYYCISALRGRSRRHPHTHTHTHSDTRTHTLGHPPHPYDQSNTHTQKANKTNRVCFVRTSARVIVCDR